MTRTDITRQIKELETENADVLAMDPTTQDFDEYLKIVEVNNSELILLKYAEKNATDEDLRIVQLALPGRCSVMNWAAKQIKMEA